MAKIKNLTDLRLHALETIDNLAAEKIDTKHASAMGKLYEDVLNSIKTELEYCRLINEVPHIPFISEKGDSRLIEAPKKKPSYLLDSDD